MKAAAAKRKKIKPISTKAENEALVQKLKDSKAKKVETPKAAPKKGRPKKEEA